ncbi:MAG: hypothetical protein JNK33_00620 [Candidatus Doudnabacteria bacterium]|nr:hypothetical protein [Candidatus Doudnabacteria bacterium]
MSKQQETWQAPDRSPLGQSNRMLVIVFKSSDLRGMITANDSTRVIVWEVVELKQKSGFPDGVREVVSIVGRKDVEFPTWLDQAISKSNGRHVFNRYKQEPMTVEEILQRLSQRLQRVVPSALASSNQSDPLEVFVRKEYDPLASNSIGEVQRVTIAARKQVDNNVTQQMVQPICDIVDAEQGCRQPQALRDAIQAALETEGKLDDEAYLGRLVAAAHAAGFPLLLPAGARRIAERLQSTGKPNPPAGDLPLLATVREEDLVEFVRNYFDQIPVPPRFEDSDFGAFYEAMALQRFAVPKKTEEEKKRIRAAISVVRLERNTGRHKRPTDSNGLQNGDCSNVDYDVVAATLAAAKALPDQVAAMEEHLLSLIGEIGAAQALFQMAPGLVETNPAELLKRVLAEAQQKLSPKQ